MSSRRKRFFDARLQRIPGADLASKLLSVQIEAGQALLQRRLTENPLQVPDAVTPSEIPSVAELGPGDRVLAELDQDGFAFAVHPADAPFFNRRPEKFPRLRYGLHIVLHKGYVCVRKRFLGQGGDAPLIGRVFALLGLFYYTEACALLRLRDLPFVPRIRDLHLTTRTLFMDYVRGQTLQHKVAERGRKILDIDLAPLGQLFAPDRDRREIEAFAGELGDTYRERIAEMVHAMNARGVAPLDVKLGNVLVGAKTGAPYWLDFERAALDSDLRYEQHLAQHRRLVEAWFGVLPSNGGPA